jgi:hypothetical protein
MAPYSETVVRELLQIKLVRVRRLRLALLARALGLALEPLMDLSWGGEPPVADQYAFEFAVSDFPPDQRRADARCGSDLRDIVRKVG